MSAIAIRARVGVARVRAMVRAFPSTSIELALPLGDQAQSVRVNARQFDEASHFQHGWVHVQAVGTCTGRRPGGEKEDGRQIQ